jgi:hypothetical protein
MNANYVKEVRRFGSSGRLQDEYGNAINLSHDDDINAAEVRTDGQGNVVESPLIRGKPCFGRPERYVRGHRSRRHWTDRKGDRRLSETPCTRCAGQSAGVYDACGSVVNERVQSSAAITATFDEWDSACGEHTGPRCFIGTRARAWHAFIDAIVDHGGWTNCNDDQVKLHSHHRRDREKTRRNAAAKKRRKRDRDARRGIPAAITAEYMRELDAERDRRAARTKSLTRLSGGGVKAMRWLTSLPDESCDRIADVWWARELLARGSRKTTGRAIAELMTNQGRSYGLGLSSLTARVYDDLKRIAKLENQTAGAPLWEPWTYSDSVTP